MAKYLKTKKATNKNFPRLKNENEAIIYLMLHNLHNCSSKCPSSSKRRSSKCRAN